MCFTRSSASSFGALLLGGYREPLPHRLWRDAGHPGSAVCGLAYSSGGDWSAGHAGHLMKLELQSTYRCRLGYGVGRIAQYNKRLPLCSGCLDSKLIYHCKYQKEIEHEPISERKTQWGQIPEQG